MHGLSSDGSQSALLKINSKNSKTSKKSKISKMARPSGQDFPKHKGGNFGKLGARILEILELSLEGLIVTHVMTDHALRLS